MNTFHARGNARLILVTAALLAAVAAAVWFGVLADDEGDEPERALTPPLSRGPLRVTVREAGSLEALNFHNVTNEVEGRTTIDYIVDEGVILTPEDVEQGTVIVRLNAADLIERRLNQEIELAAAVDAHSNAVTNLEIQLQQNASDLRKAELDVRFAGLDLERYVGKGFADRLLGAYREPTTRASASPMERAGGASADGPPAPASGLDSRALRVLISGLLESADLEGEALQRIRELNSEIHLAGEELRRAEDKVGHSERLEAKGYVSKEELEADRLALKRREIEQERARTGREQFVTYDFSKEVEKLLSGVIEAEDRLSRAKKKAQAEEAQKRSAVKARKQQEDLKRRRLESYREQEKACEIRAPLPGLVVYASSGRERRWGNDDRIQEGATVRQGQNLITIPLARSLGARINVHETVIDRVKEGQRAWVVVDAVAGQQLPARVSSVARLPNPADRWLNPDMKVYTTMLELEGEHPNLKPGMSAQVEILIEQLEDVIAVPVQAVAGTVKKPAVYVWTDGSTERREVQLGMASDHFVSVESGLRPGERVVLDPPREKGTGAQGRDQRSSPSSPKGAGGEGNKRAPKSAGRPSAGAADGAKGPAKKETPANKPGGRPKRGAASESGRR